MCLIYSDIETDQLRAAIANGQTTVWKFYRVMSYGRISPPHYGGPFEVPADGIIRSNRESVALCEVEIEMPLINRGIHVYLSEGNAEELCLSNCEVFPLTVDAESLVAAGGGEAVFMFVRADPVKFAEIINRAIANPYFADEDGED